MNGGEYTVTPLGREFRPRTLDSKKAHKFRETLSRISAGSKMHQRVWKAMFWQVLSIAISGSVDQKDRTK